MNHLLSPYASLLHAGDPTGGVPGEGEGEQEQQTYQAEMFPWLQQKKYTNGSHG